MRHFITFAVALALAAPAIAQDTISTSGSNAGAVSGSNSGAASDQAQSQGQTMNGNVGRSDATSASNSGAVSGSASDSRSLSDQTQGQASDNRNANSNTATLGQQATNQQGVTVSNQFNSYNRKNTQQEVRTNAAVPLTASSSFSSDFCGSTQSGGASASPIGISLGIAGTKYDQTCRSLRVAEKAGMLAVSANNMGFKDLSSRLTALATWSVCTANGPDTRAACEKLALFGTPEGGPLPSREEALKAISSDATRQQQEAASSQPPVVERAVAVASALPANVASPR